jgi:hypothetical protein
MSNLSLSTLVIDPHFWQSFQYQYQYNRPDTKVGEKTTIYGRWFCAGVKCDECMVRWSCSLEADGPTFEPCEMHR